jgi:hypothetical protein
MEGVTCEFQIAMSSENNHELPLTALETGEAREIPLACDSSLDHQHSSTALTPSAVPAEEAFQSITPTTARQERQYSSSHQINRDRPHRQGHDNPRQRRSLRNRLMHCFARCVWCLVLLFLLPILAFMYWPYLLLYATFVIVFLCWYCCCKREASTGLTREQVQERIIKRKCLVVETLQKPDQGSVEILLQTPLETNSVLENQLFEGPVHWPMESSDHETDYFCYHLSKPLLMDEIKSPERNGADSQPLSTSKQKRSNWKRRARVPSDGYDESNKQTRTETLVVDEEQPQQDDRGSILDSIIANDDGSTMPPALPDEQRPNQCDTDAGTVAHGAVCDICLGDYEIGDVIAWSKNVQCKHAFHADCITDWLTRRPTCPSCRQDYITIAK